jgi:hypothetical protein
MQRLQAFKYELRPNGAQRRDMGRFAGSRAPAPLSTTLAVGTLLTL